MTLNSGEDCAEDPTMSSQTFRVGEIVGLWPPDRNPGSRIPLRGIPRGKCEVAGKASRELARLRPQAAERLAAIHSLRASSIRVCQPSPVALKNSTTSGLYLTESRTFLGF